jgi:hypothetical protein
VKRASLYILFVPRSAQSIEAAIPSAMWEKEMSSLSFARIMYGTTEEFHTQVNANFTTRATVIGTRNSVAASGENFSGNPSVGKLLRLARLFLDGKAE